MVGATWPIIVGVLFYLREAGTIVRRVLKLKSEINVLRNKCVDEKGDCTRQYVPLKCFVTETNIMGL